MRRLKRWRLGLESNQDEKDFAGLMRSHSATEP
jgi:hypothetical protein